MRFALIGQPNCGKSTLFNQVAGYKAETGNFSGTTVTFTESKVRLNGKVVQVVDLPGTFTLNGTNPAEAEVIKYLTSHEVDAIINVVDATHLTQGLELTLELLPVDRPLVIAMNMMDEASRLGLHIDGPALMSRLGVSVMPLVASRGHGIKALFLKTLQVAETAVPPHNQTLVVQDALQRHQLAGEVAEKIVSQGQRRVSWRDRLDDILLHPLFGYLALVVILSIFFQLVYGFGKLIEAPVLAIFNAISSQVASLFGTSSLLGELTVGLIQGVSGGIAIVLPYLIPFLFGLSILEDVGYLPRIAFLMDGLMHRLGLHGKAIVPFILGYGCNVPAIMSTRILEERKDRIIASTLAVLVPCAARLSVVFGLVAFYLGPSWALGIYLFNIFVIALTGRILTKLLPEDTPGLILEMPAYRIPTLKNVVNKTWFRVREFIVEAWPLLIVGSLLLAVLVYYQLSSYIDVLVRPFTWLLGLPAETGVPLIFGIFRKELSLIMLRQALGVKDFSQALTYLQMLVFTVFVVFYVPCLATLSALRRELGWRSMLAVSALTVVIAMAAGLLVRGLGSIVLR
jgi:ferrous iron transport protein B